MIIRGVPKNLDNYIVVNSTQSEYLHRHGFYPKYINGDKIYYKKTNVIESVVKEINEKS